MESQSSIFEKYTKQIKGFSTFSAIAVAFVGVGSATLWVFNNFWKPKISVIEVDYAKGTALVSVSGFERHLYFPSTLAGMFGWGIRFGVNEKGDPVRIETVKDEMVKETIDLKGV